jgi:hypothetical protein
MMLSPLALWRLARPHHLRPRRLSTDPRLTGPWRDLVTDGISLTTFPDLFPDLDFEALQRDALRRRSELNVPGDARSRDEPFKAHLLGGRIGLGDIYLQVALHPSVLSIVTAYLGVVPLLRAAEVWLTAPSPGPAVQTQLWHRDGDDRMNVKLFIYLSEVTRGSGPFCFAPRTHPLGDNRAEAPDDGKGRVTDEQMSSVVGEEEWLILTGAPGTVALADTCGYHKQLKPEQGERLLFMAQYTSHHPNWPAALSVEGVDGQLTRAQRRVLPN